MRLRRRRNRLFNPVEAAHDHVVYRLHATLETLEVASKAKHKLAMETLGHEVNALVAKLNDLRATPQKRTRR